MKNLQSGLKVSCVQITKAHTKNELNFIICCDSYCANPYIKDRENVRIANPQSHGDRLSKNYPWGQFQEGQDF